MLSGGGGEGALSVLRVRRKHNSCAVLVVSYCRIVLSRRRDRPQGWAADSPNLHSVDRPVLLRNDGKRRDEGRRQLLQLQLQQVRCPPPIFRPEVHVRHTGT